MARAIHYYSLAANQNDSNAQNKLGVIYYDGIYVTRDINKAIHYFTLAANQNDSKAQFNLGVIYYNGIYVTRDINKAIHYYSLAANQNHSNAQFNLGVIYYEGIYVTRDINKAIHYYSLAADQNNSYAQFILGLMYLRGNCVPENIKKGIYLFTLSALNGCIDANFCVGYFYHRGFYMKRDVNKAIHYYKEASSFNNPYAKNNLGILFKNGYKDEIAVNLGLSIEYFKEAIRQENDEVSMYNLAHLYFYEDPIKDSIDKSIELLINSIKSGFQQSEELLCIALIKKHNFDVDIIITEIDDIIQESEELSFDICEMIINSELLEQNYFESRYEYNRNIDFLYDIDLEPCISKIIYDSEIITNSTPNPKIFNISKLFYEGFEGESYFSTPLFENF
ncbi:hypothetical protein M9Y10_003931 [Tritrichomonas musculus]|uniref:Uncharacterized protein n=1 Tax=Tritrichomonas musculus TaxID=1915356 RepID=A0ABR2JR76_9EUKA